MVDGIFCLIIAPAKLEDMKIQDSWVAALLQVWVAMAILTAGRGAIYAGLMRISKRGRRVTNCRK